MASLSEVAEELKKRNPSGRIRVGAAVDGSVVSDRAFETALYFCNEKRRDTCVILHVSDAQKTYLPRHLQPSHLERFYSDKAFCAHVHSEWRCINKVSDQSTSEVVCALADKNDVDLLVLGSIGRKGVKIDMLGSVSDYSVKSCHASVCIVRADSSRIEKGCKYLFASDGSHASAFAFCFLVYGIYKSGDIIDMVVVSNSAGQDFEKLLGEHRKILADQNVPGECFVKTIPSVQAVADGVIEASVSRECDVIVLGISGYGKKKLGSVSGYVCMKASCTTMVIKDSKDVASSFYSNAGSSSLMGDINPSGKR